jgi:hypothetical protein
VSGVGYFGSNLGVQGNTDITGGLGVTGATLLRSTLGVTGAATLSSSLNVATAGYFGSTLGVQGNTDVTGGLGVTGATTLRSTLSVSGVGFFGSALGVQGNTDITGGLGVTGATTLRSTLAVTGAANLASTLGVAGSTNIVGGLTWVSDTGKGGKNYTLPGKLQGRGGVDFTDNSDFNFEDHLNLARELRPLRDEGVLILGSGNVTHNLRRISWDESLPASDWAVEFDQMIKDALLTRNESILLNQDAKYFGLWNMAHPSVEHYLPLIYVFGCSYGHERVKFLFEGMQLGSLSMRSFLF